MTKHLFTTLFLFFLFNNVAAQYSNCYYYKLNKASSLIDVEKYEEANEILLAEKEKVDEIHLMHCLYLAKSSAGIGNEKACFSYMEQAILRGTTWATFERAEVYKPFHETENWKLLKEKYPKLQKEYYNNLNLSIHLKILKQYEQDQTIRRFYIYQRKIDTTQAKIIGDYMNRIDSLSMVFLKELVEENGFPDWNEAGFYGNAYVYIMLKHGLRFNDWAWEFFEPVMKKAVDEGKLMPFQYKSIVDDRHRCQKEPQWYGIWECDSKNCRTDYTVEEIQEIDKNRLKLGLLTLGEVRETKTISIFPDNYEPLDETTKSNLLNCNETND
ncbi:MAG: hypothetical protein ACPG49_01455 [Chitinophagales bacterium]